MAGFVSHSVFIAATWIAAIFGGIGIGAAFVSAIVGYQLTEDALSDSRAKIAAANAVAETAKADAAKANKRAEELRSDNIALQVGVRPRRFSFLGWTNHPERISKIYDSLKPYAGIVAFIQVVPDFEAKIFANDIASVLAAKGWKPTFVTEKESHMSDLNFPEGLFIFTLSDGKTQTEAGTALWTSMVDAFHEMGGEPFDGAPIHEILTGPKSGYPQFDPPITAIFVRIGLRQLSSQFLEIQRRAIIRQNEDWDAHLKEIINSGRTLHSQATDGTMVEVKIGPDGKLVSADPNKKLVEPDRGLTLMFPNGTMIRSSPPPELGK